jgi:hypothetical protein
MRLEEGQDAVIERSAAVIGVLVEEYERNRNRFWLTAAGH